MTAHVLLAAAFAGTAAYHGWRTGSCGEGEARLRHREGARHALSSCAVYACVLTVEALLSLAR